MQANPEYLRRHYASLSDEALLAIDRADLVETAQRCYDDELKHRRMTGRQGIASSRESVGERVAFEPEAQAGGDEPDWLEDASEVFSRADQTGDVPAPDVLNAREALDAAGIPCYLDRSETHAEESAPTPAYLWRLMVPGNLNLRATSVLERDVFNEDFEAEWKNHLETLSAEELRAMRPEIVFCGLFDRVERVTRAYDAEVARRELKR